MNASDDESHEPSDSSSTWLGWTLGLVVVLVVYVLTFPPVFFLAMPVTGKRPPAWLTLYASPYLWAADNTALKYPLNKYGAFWRSVLE